MKKIIALITFSLCISCTYAQKATIKDVLASTPALSPDFIKFIVPHVPQNIVDTTKHVKKVMKPKTIILPKAMTIEEIVATYYVPNPAVELQDLIPLLQNFKNGNLDTVSVVTNAINSAIVVYKAPGQKDAEEYIVQLMFNDKYQKWILNAQKMDLKFKFGAGTNYMTYE